MVILLPVLALLACAPASGPPDPHRETKMNERQRRADQPASPAPEASSVAGEWDVVSFEGYQPRRLSGTRRAAFADFGENGVSLRLECNYSGRAGTVRDGRFVAPADQQAGQTVMSCGPERNDRESRYFSFFENNPTVEAIGPDRLRLRTGDAELILARPAVHRLRYVPTSAELQGKWRMTDVTRYLPGGGYAGGGLSEVPGRIVFSADRLFYNRCPELGATVQLNASGRLTKTGGTIPVSGELACPELGGPPAAPRQPAPADILRLLHASPAVEWVDKDSLLVSTEHLGLLITRAPCERLGQSDDHRRSWTSDCASAE